MESLAKPTTQRSMQSGIWGRKASATSESVPHRVAFGGGLFRKANPSVRRDGWRSARATVAFFHFGTASRRFVWHGQRVLIRASVDGSTTGWPPNRCWCGAGSCGGTGPHSRNIGGRNCKAEVANAPSPLAALREEFVFVLLSCVGPLFGSAR